ncbi:MAG TPA: SPOR domain-containing protein, partial [Longimicrobiales bacterium]
ETGEFELVLGNKQLLGGFFIVVILFCVFFSMGYILGRNSAPMGRNTAAVEPASPSPSPMPVKTDAAAPPPVAQPPAAEQPKTGEEAKPADNAPAPTTQPAQQPGAPAQPAAPAPAPQPAAATEPIPGETYLQVMAVKRPEAEVVVKTLKDKGFPALIGPGPNDLVRVLVGPYKDAALLGPAKASLENAGFHPIVRK